MRQKNTSGSVLVCPEAGRDIGPNEELDHPSLITGCEPLEPPEAEAKDAAKADGEAAKPAKAKAKDDNAEGSAK